MVNVLAAEYSESFGKEIDPMKEIVTTIGAYEAIYCAVTAFVNEGDEVKSNKHDIATVQRTSL